MQTDTPPAPPDASAAARPTRAPALTGLRGIACILVVLLHSWTIIPGTTLERSGEFYGLFTSGNLGVSIFMVLGSFLVTRSLVSDVDVTGGVNVGGFWTRRLIRVGSQLYLLLLALWVVSWYDNLDRWTSEQHTKSLLTSATFTLNWSLIDDAAGHRADIGYLWYLSVEQQFYFAWVFVVAWFSRFRAALMTALAVGVVGVFVWRFHVLDDQGEWAAGLRTTTRSDGLLLGALAALAYPSVKTWVTAARWITVPALGTMGVLIYLSPKLDDYAYLKTQGIVFALVTALFVLAVAVAQHPTGPAERAVSFIPFVWVGRISFPLFLWHYPVFWASSRWAAQMDWFPRAVGSCVVLALVVFATYYWVERPVVRWLDGTRTGRDPTATRHEVAAV